MICLAAAGDAPTAEQLFQRGRADLDAGRVEKACAEFEDSFQAERALGTLLNMADCDERSGRRVSAWQRFVEAEKWANQNGEAKREKVARERAQALEQKL